MSHILELSLELIHCQVAASFGDNHDFGKFMKLTLSCYIRIVYHFQKVIDIYITRNSNNINEKKGCLFFTLQSVVATLT